MSYDDLSALLEDETSNLGSLVKERTLQKGKADGKGKEGGGDKAGGKDGKGEGEGGVKKGKKDKAAKAGAKALEKNLNDKFKCTCNTKNTPHDNNEAKNDNSNWDCSCINTETG